MHAKDLRIGNLITRHDLGTGEPRIEIIIELRKDKALTSGPVTVICDYEDLNPIILTNEWLLKFGLQRDFLHLQNLQNKVLRLDCNSVDDLALWISEYEDTPEETDANFNLKNIKYVHQLQNLFFALTGKELIFKY
ncbi:hypothetical protein [Elizabethkingia miricola]|uniref:hypothetical protein n=1 Tax=Elizabethkingia miricola TaxID=172045 RepID=UPI00389146B6